MTDTEHQGNPLARLTQSESFPRLAGALVCVLIGAMLALGVRTLWTLEDIPATSSFKQQMMHQKTQTMVDITDGLVRGQLARVEESAQRMAKIGKTLNWYMSSELYENNDKVFRDATIELIAAAQQDDYEAAKESALRLERSCIECHALINFESPPIQ
jgi:cytochrome c556